MQTHVHCDQNHIVTKRNQNLLKTLVLVHPGSLFGSGDYTAGYAARRCREKIRNRLLNHVGQLIVIDGFLSDEITEEFEDAIYTGFNNALTVAHRTGALDSVLAMRLWGCDMGEPPFDEWESFGSECLPRVFQRQERAAEFLCRHLKSQEIEVTGAWATEDGHSGCVNSVAEILRDGLPDARVRISETALFVEYGSRLGPFTPSFNLEQERNGHGNS